MCLSHVHATLGMLHIKNSMKQGMGLGNKGNVIVQTNNVPSKSMPLKNVVIIL